MNTETLELMAVDTVNEAEAAATAAFNNLDITENTRADYKARIGLFIEFMRQRGNLDHNAFLEFKRYLAGRNDWAVATKNKYLITAKVFLRELSRRGAIPDITQNIKTFSNGKKHKRPGLNDEEIQRLTASIKAQAETPEAVRIKALMALLIFQGLRQIEIRRLDVTDIDFINHLVFIQGKGRDDKEPVNLHPETETALKDYLRISKKADGPLFTSDSNNSQGKRISARGLRFIIKRVLKELDIKKTAHGFRHYFTTKLIQRYKGDLLEVARYTRHSSLEMLQVYNDNIQRKADLPRYYGAFKGVSL